jgi:hypothetical protein
VLAWQQPRHGESAGTSPLAGNTRGALRRGKGRG